MTVVASSFNVPFEALADSVAWLRAHKVEYVLTKLTGSGSFVPNLADVHYEGYLVGGGGGGGAGDVHGGGGGGSGGIVPFSFSRSRVGASVPYVVGAGGLAGSGAAPSDGGNGVASTFGEPTGQASPPGIIARARGGLGGHCPGDAGDSDGGDGYYGGGGGNDSASGSAVGGDGGGEHDSDSITGAGSDGSAGAADGTGGDGWNGPTASPTTPFSLYFPTPRLGLPRYAGIEGGNPDTWSGVGGINSTAGGNGAAGGGGQGFLDNAVGGVKGNANTSSGAESAWGGLGYGAGGAGSGGLGSLDGSPGITGVLWLISWRMIGV